MTVLTIIDNTNQVYSFSSLFQSINWLGMTDINCWETIYWHNYVICSAEKQQRHIYSVVTLYLSSNSEIEVFIAYLAFLLSRE